MSEANTLSEVDQFLDGVVAAAVAALRSDPIPLYTFAFYFDHESNTVSVCVDTEESSRKFVQKSNEWSMRYFNEHITDDDWDEACLFQANAGRSFSIGDFVRINLARSDFPQITNTDMSFYLAMVKAVIARQHEILALASNRDDVIFCCSTPESEVGLKWSAIAKA